MNPIMHDGTIPMYPVPLVGFAEALLWVSLASIVVVVGMMIWAILHANRESARIICPEGHRPARVLFGLRPTGARTEVLRCSVFGRGPVTCDRTCLPHAAAGPAR